MRIPTRGTSETITPLFLGGRHQLLLADGALTPIQDLPQNTTVRAYGWFVNQYKEQNIIISKAEGNPPRMWHVLSRDGREIVCGNPTAFLGEKGTWVHFAPSPDRKRLRSLNVPARTVNNIYSYGTLRQDNYWIDAVVSGILAKPVLKYQAPLVVVPAYLCQLDNRTLTTLLEELIRRSGGSKTTLDIDRIEFDDQQRLFHLFDRTKIARCTVKHLTRLAVRRRKDKKGFIERIRPGKTARIKPKSTSRLCPDPIQRYHSLMEEQSAFHITSELGNIIDRSFVCQTKTNSSR